jgi:ACT domain-containing protein
MTPRERLYVVYGAGPDAVGLVQQVTAPIAAANGNVVDVRQDVMHGLFTLFMVVDLADSLLPVEQFKSLIASIGEDAGLTLAIEKYNPVPRSSDRRSLLIILVGRDKPGIIARISEQLASYKVNIELTHMVARAGVFLMELHVDVTHADLPLGNLMQVLTEEMRAVDIRALFQPEDVFNKKKRVVCFDIGGSLIPPETLSQILRQTGIATDELRELYSVHHVRTSVEAAAAKLEGLPTEVSHRIAEAIEVTPDTVELVETLKTMGYRVVVISSALHFFTETLARKAALDGCYGYRAAINDDAQAFTGALSPHHNPQDKRRILASVLAHEGVAEEDVTVLGDDTGDAEGTPGIRVAFNMKVLLDYYNQHCLGRSHVIGLLGSFGVPRL